MNYGPSEHESLRAALREVARATEHHGMPAAAEQRLLEAFRRKQAPGAPGKAPAQQRKAFAWLAAAAVLGSFVCGAAYQAYRTPVAAVNPAAVSTPSFEFAAPPFEEPLVYAQASAPATASQRAEVATDFVSLGYSGPDPDAYQVVRVKMDRSSLAQMGLPLNPDRAAEPVDADLLVGDDGVPRAVRFVQQVSLNRN